MREGEYIAYRITVCKEKWQMSFRKGKKRALTLDKPAQNLTKIYLVLRSNFLYTVLGAVSIKIEWLYTVADLDPGSGAFLNPRSGIRDGYKIRIRDTDPGSGSGINNTGHISESLETIFLVKIIKFFDADLGSGMEKILIRDPGWKKLESGIRDKHPGSATLPATHRKTGKERQFIDCMESGGRGLGRSQITRTKESLVLCKSFNTLWRRARTKEREGKSEWERTREVGEGRDVKRGGGVWKESESGGRER